MVVHEVEPVAAVVTAEAPVPVVVEAAGVA